MRLAVCYRATTPDAVFAGIVSSEILAPTSTAVHVMQEKRSNAAHRVDTARTQRRIVE